MFKNKFTKGKLYTSLCTTLVLCLCIPAVTHAGTKLGSKKVESTDKSGLFIQLMNYAMPIVEYQNDSEEENENKTYLIKEKILSFVGLDIKNPLSIVNREFNLIASTNPELVQNTAEQPFIINPFRLNENNIIKNPTESPQKEINIPNIKTSEVYNPKIKKTLNPAKPEVLIYHTHTQESYAPNPDHSSDLTQNMSAVGEVIKDALENNYGIAVIHDKTLHDVVYNNSYARSGETLDKYLSKYKDFKIIIDLHRDSVTNKSVMTASMNETKLARYEFVLAPGNPNKDKNLALIKKLVSISESIFPGLIRSGNKGDVGIYYHDPKYRFNQQKSPYAVLIEVGSQVNTIDEAKTTGIYLSRIIAEYINQSSK